MLQKLIMIITPIICIYSSFTLKAFYADRDNNTHGSVGFLFYPILYYFIFLWISIYITLSSNDINIFNIVPIIFTTCNIFYIGISGISSLPSLFNS